MPIIEVKAFEHRFNDERDVALLITRLTEAMRVTYGDDVANQTQVILCGVAPARWGIGGVPAS